MQTSEIHAVDALYNVVAHYEPSRLFTISAIASRKYKRVKKLTKTIPSKHTGIYNASDTTLDEGFCCNCVCHHHEEPLEQL